MGVKTENGIDLTDEMMEQIARAFERGEWPGTESRIVRGRPRLFGERLQSVTFKAPARKVAALDQKAANLDMSRSDYLRHLVDSDLATTT
ncbi:MAG: hypothetical protein LBL23_00470 [Coriobacteriales bacterium]|jgi:hypothetical protein|nr:hypothetical protein [Coriobacteriales bacterium]